MKFLEITPKYPRIFLKFRKLFQSYHKNFEFSFKFFQTYFPQIILYFLRNFPSILPNVPAGAERVTFKISLIGTFYSYFLPKTENKINFFFSYFISGITYTYIRSDEYL